MLAHSSYPLRALHREAEAGQRIETALQILRETKAYPVDKIPPSNDTGAGTALRALADHYGETGQPEKAEETYRDLLARVMASNPDPQNDLSEANYLSAIYAAYAPLLRRQGQIEEAASIDARRRELWRHWDRQLPNNSFVLRQLAAAGR